jgi:hypothetical protein
MYLPILVNYVELILLMNGKMWGVNVGDECRLPDD